MHDMQVRLALQTFLNTPTATCSARILVYSLSNQSGATYHIVEQSLISAHAHTGSRRPQSISAPPSPASSLVRTRFAT
jgi:hypothetical protein